MNDDEIAGILRQGLEIQGLREDAHAQGVVRSRGVTTANAWGLLLANAVGVEKALELCQALTTEGTEGPAARMIFEKTGLSPAEVQVLAFLHLQKPAREIIDMLEKKNVSTHAC